MPVPVRLRYQKVSFVPMLALLLTAGIFLDLLAMTLLGLDLLSSLLALLVISVLVLVLGLSPFLTDHFIEDDVLVLRQGWYFKAMIPLSDISEVLEVEKGPLRTGVFFDIRGSSLYVTTQRTRLILLQLKQPRRFGYALGKKADKVHFDTLEHRKALALLQSRIIPASPGR